MKVYEMKIKVYLTENIDSEDAQIHIGRVIDSTLAADEKYLEFHYDTNMKLYSYDSFYPVEKDKIYKNDNIYNFRIRSIDLSLIKYLQKEIVNTKYRQMKVLKADYKEIKKIKLKRLFSITPAVITTDEGYWKGNISEEDFADKLRVNLYSKYNQIFSSPINGIKIFDKMEILNGKPISIKVKDVHYLGDKISLEISEDPMSQELAYLAIGTGLGEKGSRGMGFVNYKYV